MNKYSNKLIELIKEFEGLRLKRYICPGGKPTIGYGHAIQKNQNYQEITRKEAEDLLLYDIAQVDHALENATHWEPKTQNQWEALISLAFNWGVENLKKSNILKYLEKHDENLGLSLWRRIVYSNGKRLQGLVRRREAEIQLFKGD